MTPDPTAAPEPSPDPLVLAVDHVGIAVPDLDEALAWYRETLGLQVVHEETNVDQGVREAMVAVGPAGGTQLQLLAPLDDTSPIARFLDRSGPGLQQLAYRVADVEQAAQVLRARGVRVLYDEPRRGTAGSRINFLHPKDCGGVLVELVQLAGPATHGPSRGVEEPPVSDTGSQPAPPA